MSQDVIAHLHSRVRQLEGELEIVKGENHLLRLGRSGAGDKAV